MTTIDVEVSGDTMVERDEQFFVDVSNLRASGLSVEFAPPASPNSASLILPILHPVLRLWATWPMSQMEPLVWLC